VNYHYLYLLIIIIIITPINLEFKIKLKAFNLLIKIIRIDENDPFDEYRIVGTVHLLQPTRVQALHLPSTATPSSMNPLDDEHRNVFN
jgi:hypothetical protein